MNAENKVSRMRVRYVIQTQVFETTSKCNYKHMKKALSTNYYVKNMKTLLTT